MLVDSVIRIRGAALIDPDADLFDGASERHGVLVKAVEQGRGLIFRHGHFSF